MTFAAAGPVAKLLIGKALTTEKEFLGKLSDERGLYQEILGRITAEPFWKRMRQTIFYLLLYMIAGLWLACAIVMAKLLRPREHRRCAPNMELSASERIEKAETAPTYATSGFDCPEQFWEECLIRIEQREKEFAALQVTRLRLTQTPIKKQSE